MATYFKAKILVAETALSQFLFHIKGMGHLLSVIPTKLRPPEGEVARRPANVKKRPSGRKIPAYKDPRTIVGTMMEALENAPANRLPYKALQEAIVAKGFRYSSFSPHISALKAQGRVMADGHYVWLTGSAPPGPAPSYAPIPETETKTEGPKPRRRNIVTYRGGLKRKGITGHDLVLASIKLAGGQIPMTRLREIFEEKFFKVSSMETCLSNMKRVGLIRVQGGIVFSGSHSKSGGKG